MRYREFLLCLAIGAMGLIQPDRAHGSGISPDMSSMAPGMGMMGVVDQGDAVEMGQRLGKFMGSFMREMKNSPEQKDHEEKSFRTVQRDNRSPRDYQDYRDRRDYRDQRDYRDSRDTGDDWRDYDNEPRRSRYESGRRYNDSPQYPQSQYLPTYDPWGMADRGNPLLDRDSWGGGYYGRPSYGGYGGPYGAADYNWHRGRSYYGAGLGPWEAYDAGPDPRIERRWRDPSYYDPYYDPRNMDPSEYGHAPPWQYAPWSGGSRRDYWW